MTSYSEFNNAHESKIQLAEDTIENDKALYSTMQNDNTNYTSELDSIKHHTPFWLENPNVILHSFDFFPSADMSYTEKLNAISRMVIVLTCILYYITKEFRIIIIGLMTIATIYLVYSYYYSKEVAGNKKITIYGEDRELEGFNTPAVDSLGKQNIQIPKDVFSSPNSSNPFSNVLVSDYEYNPSKKPAPPSYNETVNDSILEQAKKVVRELNPDNPDITDKLFTSLGEQYIFEQSLRPFYTTASSTIPNDQEAFAEFCYGGMISCKEGNQFACARNLARYQT
jgi:hypothetical protein